MNIFKPTQYVNFLISQNYTRAARVLDSKFRLAYVRFRYCPKGRFSVCPTVFSCDPSDCATQMLTVKGLDVFDL